MAAVIFFSREGRAVGAVERESESRSRKWKEGVRDVSRPYLIVSTVPFFLQGCLRCVGVLSALSTYRCSSEFVFPERGVAHPAC